MLVRKLGSIEGAGVTPKKIDEERAAFLVIKRSGRRAPWPRFIVSRLFLILDFSFGIEFEPVSITDPT